MGFTEWFGEDVDTAQERYIVDYSKNMYGEYMCKFLIGSNCCTLNGRQCNNNDNDLTFVSTQGSSVVDYLFVLCEHFEIHVNFKYSDLQLYMVKFFEFRT